jgi:chromosome segregation ATPase
MGNAGAESEDADALARLADAQSALESRLREGDSVHDELDKRSSALQHQLTRQTQQLERLERIIDDTWRTARANTDSTHAVLQEILASRQASEERHERQQRDIHALADRMDEYDIRVTRLERQFEERVGKMERSFPSRAWSLTLAVASWLLTAGLAGVATITWSIWSQWIGA